MTPAQLTTLNAFILADPVMKLLPNNSDGWYAMEGLFNQPVSPSFTVWKTNVAINDVGKSFNGTELAGMTTADQTRLQTLAMYLAGGVNPSLADNRQFFNDVFSGAGGATTRANLLALWKRFATVYEKIYATGTGTDASPATLVLEGPISRADIQTAMGH